MLNLPDNRFNSVSEVTLTSILVTVESGASSVLFPSSLLTVHSFIDETSVARTSINHRRMHIMNDYLQLRHQPALGRQVRSFNTNFFATSDHSSSI